MIPDPPRHAKTPPPSAAELSAQVDGLLSRVGDAERRIDDALAPEPVDWEAHYHLVLADAAEAGRRVAALAQDGGA